MTKETHALHQDLFGKVKDLELSFSIVPSALELVLRGAEAYSIGRIPLFRIGERRIFILTPYLKRLFDVSWAVLIGPFECPYLDGQLGFNQTRFSRTCSLRS